MKNKILTEEQIIAIAKSNGGEFTVSPRYRDDTLRAKLHTMKKQGIFKQIGYGVYEKYLLKAELWNEGR